MSIIVFIFCFLLFCGEIFSWTPIGSCYNMRGIHSITIAERDYVVWKTETNQYIVQDNVCPHRFAPLSEGRLEKNTLQCRYHGWQFNSQGNCTVIPQSSSSGPYRCSVPTYRTRRTGDILWANIPTLFSKEQSTTEFWKTIQKDEILQNATVPYIREVPYSWNFLMENLFDPAHVPFAHHGLQSYRDDAGPLPIYLMDMSLTKLSFLFEDKSNGTVRNGIMELHSPYLYKLWLREENQWKSHLTILCIPIKPGRTRVILCSNQRLSIKKRQLLHEFHNQFFNTDDYLIHQQEIYRQFTGNSYYMPTSSDYAVKVCQKWIKRYYPRWEFQNTIELKKSEALDNQENHINHCMDCQRKQKKK